MFNIAVGALLATWFVLSLAANSVPLSSPLRRRRFSWLLPEWRFFAPTPATHDYELFYRARGRDTPPTEIHIVKLGEVRWWNFVINPTARVRKATRDALERFLRESIGHTSLDGGASHRAILRELKHQVTEPADFMQWGVLLVQGGEESLAYVSCWQAVGSDDAAR